MSKALVIGAACTATAAAAAGAVYYVSPEGDSDLDTPPILFDGTPEQAFDTLRKITARQYLQQVGGSSRDAEIVRLTLRQKAPDRLVATITVDTDRILVLQATVRPAEGGKTALDITADVPDSRFSKNPALHPYDRKVIAAIADFAATDYVSSLLKRQRMVPQRELGAAVELRVGFDETERRAFGERVTRALIEAYGRRQRRDWDRDPDAYDPTPRDWPEDGSTAYDAERAAESARDAAAEAARAAHEAVEASRGYNPSEGYD